MLVGGDVEVALLVVVRSLFFKMSNCGCQRAGYDKVPKHASIACRQQADFVGRDMGKKLK